MLGAMAEEIRRRGETPDEEFVEHAPGDFPRILDRTLADRGSDDADRGRHRAQPARSHGRHE